MGGTASFVLVCLVCLPRIKHEVSEETVLNVEQGVQSSRVPTGTPPRIYTSTCRGLVPCICQAIIPLRWRQRKALANQGSEPRGRCCHPYPIFRGYPNYPRPPGVRVMEPMLPHPHPISRGYPNYPRPPGVRVMEPMLPHPHPISRGYPNLLRCEDNSL